MQRWATQRKQRARDHRSPTVCCMPTLQVPPIGSRAIQGACVLPAERSGISRLSSGIKLRSVQMVMRHCPVACGPPQPLIQCQRDDKFPTRAPAAPRHNTGVAERRRPLTSGPFFTLSRWAGSLLLDIPYLARERNGPGYTLLHPESGSSPRPRVTVCTVNACSKRLFTEVCHGGCMSSQSARPPRPERTNARDL